MEHTFCRTAVSYLQQRISGFRIPRGISFPHGLIFCCTQFSDSPAQPHPTAPKIAPARLARVRAKGLEDSGWLRLAKCDHSQPGDSSLGSLSLARLARTGRGRRGDSRIRGPPESRAVGQKDETSKGFRKWLWVKHWYPKWNPGLKPAAPGWFEFDP